MCKVSILVPIYNVEKYLHQCLESVVNQTLKDIEIICINDGSTDNSLSIIKKFAEKDSRIKIIDKKNTGYGHSMNCGLKIAQGEYIGIVESDDFADLDMFETLYNTAKINEVEVIKSNYLRQVQEKYVFAEYLNQQPYNKIFSPLVDNFKLLTCFPNIWSGLYKREFLLENGIYFNETPGASYQDVGFIFKVWFFAKKVFLIKDAFLHYRVDNPNASVKSKNKAFCIFDEFDEIKKFLVKQANVPDTFNYMFSVYKYKEFESNFERIDDQFRFEFFNRTFREFENDDNAKYLNKKYWQDENWQSVQKLIKYKKEFFCDQYKHQQDIHIFREGFFNVLESSQFVQKTILYKGNFSF